MASITSSNAVLMLSIAALYPTPQQLQGFAADDIFDVDNLPIAEGMMGVDGYLSAGKIFEPIVMRIMLQADSPSNVIFETWKKNQDQIGDLYWATLVATLSSVGRIYTCTQGFMRSISVVPNARRVLQPRQYELVWQSVTPAPTPII